MAEYRNTEIDQLFPVAGVDNDSQGFRDNFDAIKDTVTRARADIEDLQDSRLNRLSASSDMGGNTIVDANLKGFTETQVAGGTINTSTGQLVKFTDGSYQVFTVAADDVVFSLSDWPVATRYANLRLHLSASTTARVVEFISEGVSGAGTIRYDSAFPTVFSVPVSPEAVVVEFWSFDGGNNVYAKILNGFGEAVPTVRLHNVSLDAPLVIASSEDLAASGAASLTKATSYFSTSTAETSTLAAGTEGQIKVLAMTADNGDMVVTVTNAGWKASGTGTITFDAIGDACTLQYINSKWYCIGNNGASFA